MKVKISLGRTVREYTSVVVEAASVEAAQEYCDTLLATGDVSQAYCDLVNAGTWRSDADSIGDEAVTYAEACEDEDEEADIVVPAMEDAR